MLPSAGPHRARHAPRIRSTCASLTSSLGLDHHELCESDFNGQSVGDPVGTLRPSVGGANDAAKYSSRGAPFSARHGVPRQSDDVAGSDGGDGVGDEAVDSGYVAIVWDLAHAGDSRALTGHA